MKMDYGVCPQPQQTTATHGDIEEEINHKAYQANKAANQEMQSTIGISGTLKSHLSNMAMNTQHALRLRQSKLLRDLQEVEDALHTLNNDPAVQNVFKVLSVAGK